MATSTTKRRKITPMTPKRFSGDAIPPRRQAQNLDAFFKKLEKLPPLLNLDDEK